MTCRLVPDGLSPGTAVRVLQDDNDNTRLFEASADDDGTIEVRAIEFDNSDLTDDERPTLHDGAGDAFGTVDGGTELRPCAD